MHARGCAGARARASRRRALTSELGIGAYFSGKGSGSRPPPPRPSPHSSPSGARDPRSCRANACVASSRGTPARLPRVRADQRGPERSGARFGDGSIVVRAAGRELDPRRDARQDPRWRGRDPRRTRRGARDRDRAHMSRGRSRAASADPSRRSCVRARPVRSTRDPEANRGRSRARTGRPGNAWTRHRPQKALLGAPCGRSRHRLRAALIACWPCLGGR